MTIDDVIQKENTTKPRLLLHVCCAPCLTGVVERLTQNFDVTAFFYNPNISPNEEFIKRLDALKTVVAHFDTLKLIVPEQNENDFISAVQGYESEPEGGARCAVCFKVRLEKTADFFAVHKTEYDYFATTLTVSPHKNAALVNKVGRDAADKYGAAYLDSDFKKHDGFLRSIQLSKELGIFRQNYCGCEFSNR